MVSIPDWSKFGRLGEIQKEPVSIRAKYDKIREAETIKQAEESGYFLKADRAFIEKNILGIETTEEDGLRTSKKSSYLFDDESEDEIDLGGIFHIRLIHARLRSVGDLGLCRNLRICILHNNFITRFDSLVTCTQLVKLDLHSNQIQTLPAPAFWASMTSLQILNLHDNPIGRIENLHNLAACPYLIALTMYDTPLSLKRNYRHHVVNSIWPLKALDNYVISDEEIIEDAEFRGRFSAMHPNFSVEVCPPLPRDTTYEAEVDSLLSVMAVINNIQAHNSPVLIIQRYVRGYLTRKQLHLMSDTRTCIDSSGAATTIQRKFRMWTSSNPTTPKGAPPPPSSSPAPGDKPSKTELAAPAKESARLDYDTYLKHRRPGSTIKTESESAQVVMQKDQLPPDQDNESGPASHRLPGTPIEGRKQVYINLAKLEAGTLQSYHEQTMVMEAFVAQRSTQPQLPTHTLQSIKKKHGKRKREEKKKVVIKSVKQFFGPVVETVSSPEPDTDTDEDIPAVKFRLRGYKQNVQYYDPLTDLVISRKEAARMVKAAENDYHIEMEMKPEPFIENKSQPNADTRLFHRMQGTMGLSCLRAVDQAYKDRAKAQRKASKMEFVANIRDQKEAAKRRIQMQNDERRNKSLIERERDHRRMVEILEKRELQRLGYIDKNMELRTKSSRVSKMKKGEMSFVTDFRAQNTSVSKALLRHDRAAKREDTLTERAETVQTHKAKEREQQEMVQRYLEHRQLMRQTESALARAALDTRMLQEANERLMESKQRVAQQRARSQTAHDSSAVMYPVPNQTIFPPVPDSNRGLSATSNVKSLERWGASVYQPKPETLSANHAVSAR